MVKTLLSPALVNNTQMEFSDEEPKFLEGTLNVVADEILDGADERYEHNHKKKSFLKERIITDSSLVVGLSGMWGSGKTSAANLLIQKLDHKQEFHTKIFMNAWDSTSPDMPLSANILLEASKMTSKNKKHFKEFIYLDPKLAKAKEAYHHEIIKQSAYIILAVVAFLAIALLPYLNDLIKIIAGAITVIIVAAISNFLLRRKFLTPSEGRAILMKKFLSLPRTENILVVIDDLDRLSQDEIPQVFKILRETVNFPNIVFLVLYDEVKIYKAMEVAGYGGESYIRKIFDLNYRLYQPLPEEIIEKYGNGTKSAIGARFLNVIRPNSHPFQYVDNLDTRRDFDLLLRNLNRIEQQSLDFEVDDEHLFLIEYIRQINPSLWRFLQKHYIRLSYDSEFDKKSLEFLDYLLSKTTYEEKQILTYLFDWLKFYEENLRDKSSIDKGKFDINSLDKDTRKTIIEESYKQDLTYGKRYNTSERDTFLYKDVIAFYFRNINSVVENKKYIQALYSIVDELFKGANSLNPRISAEEYFRVLDTRIEDSAHFRKFLKALMDKPLHPESQIDLFKALYKKAQSFPELTRHAKRAIFKSLIKSIQNWTMSYRRLTPEFSNTKVLEIWSKYFIEEANLHQKLIVALSWASDTTIPNSHNWNKTGIEWEKSQDTTLQGIFNIPLPELVETLLKDPLSSFLLEWWFSSNWAEEESGINLVAEKNKKIEELYKMLLKESTLIKMHSLSLAYTLNYLNKDWTKLLDKNPNLKIAKKIEGFSLLLYEAKEEAAREDSEPESHGNNRFLLEWIEKHQISNDELETDNN